MDYDKPHLNYEEQLRKLAGRGMGFRDHAAAIAALQRIGYYRLSAYVYPFRARDSDGRRLDNYVTGTTMEAVVDLYDFDVKLRAHLLAGLERFEVALRVQVAYVLGKRDKYGHLNRSSLDAVRCDERRRSEPGGPTNYEIWTEKYQKRCSDSRNEDFVKHFAEKYDGRLPIWVATEVMDLGGIVRLYGFLRREDRTRISRNLGVQSDADFSSWIRALNLLRNHCAHGDRIWNRTLVYRIAAVKPDRVDPLVAHLSATSETGRAKLHAITTVLAYLVGRSDPYSNWHRTLSTQIKKLPAVPGIATPEVMGFPADWHQNDVWTREPKVRES